LKDFEKAVQDLVDKNQKNEIDQRIDIMIKVASTLYDKAVAYTNVIILAGYAAFFTVWSNMKARMSHTEMLVAAFCITFSLVFFVFWEVTKMIINSKSLTGLLNVLKAPSQEFDQRLAELQKADHKLNIRLLQFWIVFLIFTVVPGLIAAAVLLWSFGRQLWVLI
jgi:hypothetical protein